MDSIYDDLDVQPILDIEYKKVQTTNIQLLENISQLEAEVQRQQEVIAVMKKQQEDLERNISSLYNTAIAECGRKDRLIAELRKKVDDMAFRRDAGRRQDSYASHKSTTSTTSSQSTDRHYEKSADRKGDRWVDKSRNAVLSDRSHRDKERKSPKRHVLQASGNSNDNREKGRREKDNGRGNDQRCMERDRERNRRHSPVKRSRVSDRKSPPCKKSKSDGDKQRDRDKHAHDEKRESADKHVKNNVESKVESTKTSENEMSKSENISSTSKTVSSRTVSNKNVCIADGMVYPEKLSTIQETVEVKQDTNTTNIALDLSSPNSQKKANDKRNLKNVIEKLSHKTEHTDTKIKETNELLLTKPMVPLPPKTSMKSPVNPQLTFEGCLKNNLLETTFVHTQPITPDVVLLKTEPIALPKGDVSSIFNNNISPIPKTNPTESIVKDIEIFKNSTKINIVDKENVAESVAKQTHSEDTEKPIVTIGFSNENVSVNNENTTMIVDSSQVAEVEVTVTENQNIPKETTGEQDETASDLSANTTDNIMKGKARPRRRYIGQLRMED